MTTVSTEGLDQLHDPERAVLPILLSVDTARRLAREAVAECAAADPHSLGAMLMAATTLDYRLRSLLAALDAEEGR
ncbi:hypothetical protein GCM10010497_45890 [Streptomyces cinereoruber]|uniref:Uncharacterized protein n=1 Tax=Streptomyces cinereoruber TaxID=67260 RepID=A0AAV4KPK6_9ACTN|nr:hypothetical protein [Streptomyces cinereoruber]MBB4160058.1 hypothetical protein [Streptomyces cinereoruber]MBY8818331.1 hypothetical protein [Streptomyces cinereoruber]NIH60996.1 hypothetical protein [Streptomyces cinereoruber]QEV33289.1 hypothetical protein CP977_14855 [Streptomyces cinereoruber]GGR37838.1 hypothetical protein GCM10010497_45890 [Streptomyces cinereoruber]